MVIRSAYPALACSALLEVGLRVREAVRGRVGATAIAAPES
jgi:hypothetical protein